MKKILLLTGMVLVAVSIRAQIIIPRIGVAFSYNTQYTSAQHTKPGAGLVAGLGYSTKMTDRLTFQPEIYFIQKVFRFDYSSTETITSSTTTSTTNLKVNDKYNIGYLDIPLLFKLKVAHNKMFVILGPYISFGIGGRYSYDHTTQYSGSDPIRTKGSGNIYFGDKPVGVSSDTYLDHRFDFGFQPGVGVTVYKKIQIELRGALGLLSVYRGSHAANQSLMLTASIPVDLSPVE